MVLLTDAETGISPIKRVLSYRHFEVCEATISTHASRKNEFVYSESLSRTKFSYIKFHILTGEIQYLPYSIR